MIIQAELSLYPLGTDHLSLLIDEFVQGLSQPGINVKPGAMSTVISGELGDVFRVVSECFKKSSVSHELVLVVKYSNACPAWKSGPPMAVAGGERGG